jgi:AcrR family transcriptional regulator
MAMMPAPSRAARAARHRLIVRTARELAEAEGWDAVTVRRLADRIEYSQPVLYSHFAGREAIVTAVAVEGFAELADARRQTRAGVSQAGPGGQRGPDGVAGRSGQARPDGEEGDHEDAAPPLIWAAVARAYTEFAAANRALYAAMFSLATDLPFARPEAPAPLKAAFGEIYNAVAPLAGGRDPGTLAEVAWSALHGVVTLNQAGRLAVGGQDDRLALLIGLLAAPAPR